MSHLSFMSDDHLENCIRSVCKRYASIKKKSTLDDLYKNSIDPIKAFFDIKPNEISMEKYMYLEGNRQADKAEFKELNIKL